MIKLDRLRFTDNEIVYSDELSHNNKIMGILLPTDNAEVALGQFLTGLPNMIDISEFSTILFNFQKWSQEDIDKAVDICHDNGFKVRYTINKYNCDPEVPFNLIMEDTASLMDDAIVYLSMDDDITVLGLSPTIGKTGGRQYLECLHYMLHNKQCGIISTTGTIGKIPKRNYLGPNFKRNIDLYIMTGLGLFLKNMRVDRNDDTYGCVLPIDSLELYGALGDALVASYRKGNGYYPAKYNHIRAVHPVQTNIDETKTVSPYGWDKAELIDNGVAKYTREHWNPKYNWKRMVQNSVTPEQYTEAGGLPIWNEEVALGVTSFYPVDGDLDQLRSEVISKSLEIRQTK